MNIRKPIITRAESWPDYALLDTGNGKKLERFGTYCLIRPEPQALWLPALDVAEWKGADGEFVSASEEGSGRWRFSKEIDRQWVARYGPASFVIKPTPFRHVGIFPEHRPHWDWMEAIIKNSSRQLRILNLFGYTGIPSLIAAAANAEVTHVDASKQTIAWAKENQRHSGLGKKQIRWIVDDALGFVKREERRMNAYDGLIIDPPKFGRGPKGEIWKLHEQLPELLEACRNLLSGHAAFVILTAYAVRISGASMSYLLEDMTKDMDGTIEAGEMALVEQSRKRVLPQAVFSRWNQNT